jgi:hypothetical protein
MPGGRTEPSLERVSAGWDRTGTEAGRRRSPGLRLASLTRLAVAASRRWTELDALTGTSSTARAALRVEAPGHLTVIVEAGATLTRSGEGAGARDRRFAVGGSRATVRLSNRFSLGGGVSRSAFDETAHLIQSAITTTTWTAEGDLQLPGRLVVSGGGEVANLEGGSGPNRRRAGFTVLRWQPRRFLSMGLAGRGFNYDNSPRDGYFAPAQFRLGEISARYGLGRELGWGLTLDLGIGLQRVVFDGPATTSGTQRVGLSAAYRPRPGAEVGLKYEFSNVAGAGAVSLASGSVYHASNLSLRMRLTPK